MKERAIYLMRTPEKMAEVIEALDPFQVSGVPCWKPAFTQYLTTSVWSHGAVRV